MRKEKLRFALRQASCINSKFVVLWRAGEKGIKSHLGQKQAIKLRSFIGKLSRLSRWRVCVYVPVALPAADVDRSCWQSLRCCDEAEQAVDTQHLRCLPLCRGVEAGAEPSHRFIA